MSSQTGQTKTDEKPLPGPSPVPASETTSPQIDSDELARPSQETTIQTSPLAGAPPPPDHSGSSDPVGIDPTQEAQGPTAFAAPMPLESVWPVERRTTIQSSRGKPVAAPDPHPTQSGPPTLEKPYEDDIQQYLSDLTPSGKTDSSIDFVTPRRPRPVPLPEKGGHEPAVRESDTETIARTAQAGATQPETPPPAKGPRIIETDIGPLPSDLWELIGDTAPPTFDEGTPEEANDTVSATSPTPQANWPSAPSQDSPTMPEIRTANAATQLPNPQVVQRTSIRDQSRQPRTPQTEVSPTPSEAPQRPSGGRGSEQEAQAPPPVSEPEESEAPQEESETAPDLDMDELARQVYQTIKRRMRVEKDRLPGR